MPGSVPTGSGWRKGSTRWVPSQPVPLLPQEPAFGRPAQTAPWHPSPRAAAGSPAGLDHPHLFLRSWSSLPQPQVAQGPLASPPALHPQDLAPGCPGNATAPPIPQPALPRAPSSRPSCPMTLGCPSHSQQEGVQPTTPNMAPNTGALQGSGPRQVPAQLSLLCIATVTSHCPPRSPKSAAPPAQQGTQHRQLQSSPRVPPPSLPAQKNLPGSTLPAAQSPRPMHPPPPAASPPSPPCPGAVPPQTTLSLQSLHSRRLSAFTAQR